MRGPKVIDGKVVTHDGKVVTATRCLPDTITVTLSGFADAFPPITTSDPLPLAFSSCFGSGATGTVTQGTTPGTAANPILTGGGSGYAVPGRAEPVVSYTTVFGTGSGANITAILTESTDSCGRPRWLVDGFTVNDGGSGYTAGDPVEVELLATDIYGDEDGFVYIYGECVVDGGGVITAITPLDLTHYVWANDLDLPALVASVTVSVDDGGGFGAGFGAAFTVTIDDDVDSETFGEITGITLTDEGEDYNFTGGEEVKRCCGDFFDGRAIVLKRGEHGCGTTNGFNTVTPSPENTAPDFVANNTACYIEHRLCTVAQKYSSRGAVRVVYRGESIPPIVYVRTEAERPSADVGARASFCDATLTTETLIGNGDPFEFTATNEEGATAVVTEGGTYNASDGNADPDTCYSCCMGDTAPPQEITVALTHMPGTWPDRLPEGDYTFTLQPIRGYLVWEIDVEPGDFPSLSSFQLDHALLLMPCARQTDAGWTAQTFQPPSASEFECNDCHKKCMTIAAAVYQVIHATDGVLSSIPSHGTDCTVCDENPQCEPAAGSYDRADLGVTLTVS